MSVEEIPVDAILAGDSIQQRSGGLDAQTVARYVADADVGWPYPPIVIFQDPDGRYLVADGAHRVEAARRLEIDSILAEIHEGTWRDATLYACGANAKHGLPRTNADKRKAVATMLTDPDWSQWSDREIARRCCVHHQLVSRMRVEARGVDDHPPAVHECTDESATVGDESAMQQSTAAPPVGKPTDVRATSGAAEIVQSKHARAGSAEGKPSAPLGEGNTPPPAIAPSILKVRMEALHRLAGAASDVRRAGLDAAELRKAINIASILLAWLEEQASVVEAGNA